MAQAHNFSYGLINPILAYLISSLGCFLGLQCTARARAMQGASRARWLLLAAVSIGTTGIWVMHFIAMLGYTISGQVISYNVPVTILSMLIAVVVVAVGLFIVGFGREDDVSRLLLGGSIIGIGVAGMHYMGMWAMRMPDTMAWSPTLLILSVIIAMVAGTAALWCANKLNGLTATLVASLIMGVAVSGMHYTGMAALHVYTAPGGGMLSMGAGAGATSFLLPLILGISIVTFLVTAIVTMAPTAAEMREDAALMERIATLSKDLGEGQRRLPRRRVSTGHVRRASLDGDARRVRRPASTRRAGGDMGSGQLTGNHRISLGVAATVAAVVMMPLAGAGGRAAAQAHPGTGARVAAAGTIATVAGGVGGPAKATKLFLTACGVTADGGSLYIGGFTSVRKVNPGTDGLTTPVGTGVEDPLGDDGPATRAGLSGSCGMALDRAGNLVIVDQSHERVRVVAASTGTFYGQAMTVHNIYTVAGNGSFGSSGDGGPATSASLGSPEGVAVDHAGNLVITATGSNRVRVVAVKNGTFYGRTMTAGDIYTVAGNGTFGFSGDGGRATAAEFANPWDVAVDAAGNLVITDFNNERIRVVAVKTGTFYGRAMTAQDIYTVAGGGTTGLGDGGPATSAELAAPQSVAVDGDGNLVLADLGHDRVRVVPVKNGTFYGQAMTAQHIYTVAGNGTAGPSGDGGSATAAGLAPWWAAVDSSGDLLIADLNSHEVRMVAASTGSFYGRPMTAGDIYTIAGGQHVTLLTGLGGPATKAQIYQPNSVALDGTGNVLVTARNDVLLTAASTGTFYGRPVTAGNIYAVAGGGTSLADGGPAISARLGLPQDASLDAAGNLLIADSGFDRIQVVAARTGGFYGRAMTVGHIYTVAGGGNSGLGDGGPATSAELSHPEGVAVDHAGNLVIGDSFNERVRVVAATTGTFYGQAMTAGDIYTLAGDGSQGFSGDSGPATSAELSTPAQLAVDHAGNIVIADTANQRIRVVAASTGTSYGQPMTAGDIYTVAGGGTGGLGDGGPATSAEISFPSGLALDGSGNLLIADSGFARIRVVPVTTGTFYGQAMAADHIYTVAGNGNPGFSGDGGPATSAEIDKPGGVAPDGTGGLLIADAGSGRVRTVAG